MATQQSVLELILRTIKTGEGVEEAERELARLNETQQKSNTTVKESKFSWTDLKSALDVGKQAFQAVAGAVQSMVGPVIDYGKQVRDLSAFSGASAEESSELIQVLDDLGVEYGTLRTAAKGLTENGLQPNLKTLAELADEYQAIQDPVQRSQFLIERFGARAGPQLAFALDQGKDALLEMGEAARETGLVVGEEFLAQAREAELAVDNWEDSVLALKIALSDTLLPAVSAVVNQGAAVITWFGNVAESVQDGTFNLGEWNKLAYEVVFTDKTLAEANAEIAESNRVLGSTLDAYDPKLEQVAQSTADADAEATALAAQEAYLAGQLAGAAQAAADNEAAVLAVRDANREAEEAARDAAVAYYDLAEQFKDATAADLAKASISELKTALDEGRITSGEYNAAVRDIQLQFELATPQSMAMAGAVQNLSKMYADGKITSDEYTNALGLVESAAADGQVELGELGLSVRDQVIPAFDDAASAANDYEAELNGLDGRTVTTRVVTEYEERYYNYRADGATQARAAGGSHGAGPLQVGELGTELLFAGAPGYVVNHGDTNSMLATLRSIEQSMLLLVRQASGSQQYNVYTTQAEVDIGLLRALAGGRR